MKKLISVMALILVAAMLLVTPVYAVEDYERSYGQDTIKANKLTTAPVIDGSVSATEYGVVSSAKTAPNAWMHSMPLGGAGNNDTYDKVSDLDPRKDAEWAYLKDRTMAKLDTWFAYDDENIYIAYYQLSGVWDTDADADATKGNAYNEYFFRSNYVMRVGFNLSNAYELLQIEYSMPTFDENGVAVLEPKTSGQGGLRFTFTMGNCSNPYNCGTPYEDAANFLVGGRMSKKYIDGTPIVGNVNSKKGQFIECIELAFNKKGLLEAFNDMGGTDYTELPNAMFFFFSGRHYSWADEAMTKVGYEGQTMWFGTHMSQSEQDDYGAPFSYYPDLVVFGDKVVAPGAEATTEAPTAAPTDAPTTEAPTDAPTDAPTAAPSGDATTDAGTEPAKGCGSTVTVAGLAIVAALGTCAVFVEKKRK